MFLGGFGVWAFLAAWSLSAFWQHIDSLKPTYKFAAQSGACGAEFVLLVMVFYHCFDVHINVRKWSLLLGAALGVLVLLHAGALRGLDDAAIAQDDTEKRIKEAINEATTKQIEDAARVNKENSTGLRQRERLAMDAKLKAAQTELQKSAQAEIVKTIAGRSEAIKSTSWLPKWYLNGGMYAVMFIGAIVVFTIVSLGRLNTEDVDRNYDGIPDNQQSLQDLVVGEDFPVDHMPQMGKARRSLLDRLRGE